MRVASAQMTVSSGSLHLHLPKAYGKTGYVDFVYHFVLQKQVCFLLPTALAHRSVAKRNYTMHYFGLEISRFIFLA